MRASNEPDSTPVGRTAKPDMRLRRDELTTIMDLAKWSDAELARQSGLDQSAIGRLRGGELGLGARSIACLLLAVWGRFGKDAAVKLFDVIDENGDVIPVYVYAKAENGARGAGA